MTGRWAHQVHRCYMFYQVLCAICITDVNLKAATLFIYGIVALAQAGTRAFAFFFSMRIWAWRIITQRVDYSPHQLRVQLPPSCRASNYLFQLIFMAVAPRHVYLSQDLHTQPHLPSPAPLSSPLRFAYESVFTLDAGKQRGSISKENRMKQRWQ